MGMSVSSYIARVGLVAVCIGDLASVARVRQEEEVPLGERFGCILECLLHRAGGSVLSEEKRLSVQALRLGDLSHVVGVRLARTELPVPPVVMVRIHAVEPDVDGHSLCHSVTPSVRP